VRSASNVAKNYRTASVDELGGREGVGDRLSAALLKILDFWLTRLLHGFFLQVSLPPTDLKFVGYNANRKPNLNSSSNHVHKASVAKCRSSSLLLTKPLSCHIDEFHIWEAIILLNFNIAVTADFMC
jgi:hypothetical protein